MFQGRLKGGPCLIRRVVQGVDRVVQGVVQVVQRVVQVVQGVVQKPLTY